MSGTLVALTGFAFLLVLIVLRAPIGLAMFLTGAAGYTYLSSGAAFFGYMKTNAYHQFANYTLSVIPLFILMGALAQRAGIAAALFKSSESVLGRYKGGLAMAVHRGLHGFRRDLRIVGRDHGHLRPRRAAGTQQVPL